MLFEFEGGVHRQLLAVGLAEGLCPALSPRVALVLEVLVALGGAEAEYLVVVVVKIRVDIRKQEIESEPCSHCGQTECRGPGRRASSRSSTFRRAF